MPEITPLPPIIVQVKQQGKVQVSPPSFAAGESRLAKLLDVSISNQSNGAVLYYNSANGDYEFSSIDGERLSIQIRRSATSGVTPTSLANGELFLNFADQLLYYKHSNGSIITLANGAFTGSGIDLYARAHSNAAYTHTNTAYDTANTAVIIGLSAFNQANSGIILAFSAYDKANSANIFAQVARDQANAAYDRANTANTTGQAAFDTANGAFTKANNAAQLSFVTLNVAGQNNVVADSNSDTLILVPGSGIIITTDAPNDTVTLTATGVDQFARDHSNGAFSQANTANTANTVAASAYAQANIATTNADAAFSRANAAYANANTAIYTAVQIRTNISNSSPINYDATTGVISHALSGVVASGYGDAATIPKVVVDATGHVASVTNTSVAVSASQITSGTLAVVRGGTGQTAITMNGSLLIGNTVSGGFDVNPIIQGTNITITNDKGSITIASSDAFAQTQANAAYNRANTANTTGQAAFDQANAAYNRANTANTTGQAAFDQANTANTTGQASFDKANGAFTKANGSAQQSFVTVNIAGQANVVADSNSDTLIFVAGASMVITTDAANDTITFSSTASGSSGNTFSTINVSGQSDIVADSNADTLTIVAGPGTTITTDAPNDAITISSNVTSVAGRLGSVVLNTNDVTENIAGPYYFTAARVRSNISNTAPINYDSSTGVISHALSGVGATGYGDSSHIPVFVVDNKGHITSVSNVAVETGVGATDAWARDQANAAYTRANNAYANANTAIYTATQIRANISNTTPILYDPATGIISLTTVPVLKGGTGQTAITVNGSLLIGNTVSGGYDINSLTPGIGIVINNDKGSISIAATGGSAIDQFARDKANLAFITSFALS